MDSKCLLLYSSGNFIENIPSEKTVESNINNNIDVLSLYVHAEAFPSSLHDRIENTNHSYIYTNVYILCQQIKHYFTIGKYISDVQK